MRSCGNQELIGPPERGYAVMRDALNATGRPIIFAACEWAVNFPATWMAPVANSYRTTYDIQNKWEWCVRHAQLHGQPPHYLKKQRPSRDRLHSRVPHLTHPAQRRTARGLDKCVR